MEIKSDSFKDGEYLAKDYSCQGQNISPGFSWSGAPANTKSFAIICDDPDAPVGDWVHWVVFNIPGNTAGLGEGISQSGALPKEAVEGKNDFGKNGYGGACPPPGKPHRYFFKLYALDVEKLPLDASATKKALLAGMKGHIVAEAKIIGLYKR